MHLLPNRMTTCHLSDILMQLIVETTSRIVYNTLSPSFVTSIYNERISV